MSNERFYEIALQEFENGGADAGLLAKAFVKSNGDESRKKIEYIKLRVTQLENEKIGNVAKSVAPSLISLIVYVAKITGLIAVIAIMATAIAELRGIDSGYVIGQILSGIIVIQIIAKSLEWLLLKRFLKNKNIMAALSIAISFFIILIAWHTSQGKPYAINIGLVVNFFFSSISVFAIRVISNKS